MRSIQIQAADQSVMCLFIFQLSLSTVQKEFNRAMFIFLSNQIAETKRQNQR